MDASLRSAFREREMRVEHRINQVRALLLTIGYLVNLVNAWKRGLLGGPYDHFLAAILVFLVVYMVAVDRLTVGGRYRPWVKYLTITVDLAVALSFYLEIIRPEFAGRVDLQSFRGTEIGVAVVLVIVTALRQSQAAIAYGTLLGTAMAVYLAWQPGEPLAAHTWWPTVLLMAGGITWWVSANLRSLVLSLWRRQRLTRFLPKQLVTLVEHDDLYLNLGGEGVVATILLADIREFTRLSEERPAPEIVALLNEYFTAMAEVIFRHGGMLDKFMGDAIMAVFGAPFPRPDDPLRALKAAEEMLETVEALNARWRTEGRPEIQVGVALHTGEVVAGNIGSPQRMDYTVIGDPVNLVSRLEGLNKRYGTRLVLSEATFEAAGLREMARFIEETTVRGRTAPIRVYTLRRTPLADEAVAAQRPRAEDGVVAADAEAGRAR